MADRQFVYCPPLCFLVKRYSILELKVLKTALVDFYDPENISRAKTQLEEDVDEILKTDNTGNIRPRLQRRINNERRIHNEVDDIVTLYTFVDEKKLSHKLPIYVATSPDELPHLRILDSDFQLLVHKLSRLEAIVLSLQDEVHRLSVQTRTQVPPTGPSVQRPPIFSTVSDNARGMNNMNTCLANKTPIPADVITVTTNNTTVGKTTTNQSVIGGKTMVAAQPQNSDIHSNNDDSSWSVVVRNKNKRPRVYSGYHETENIDGFELNTVSRTDKQSKPTRLLVGKKADGVSVSHGVDPSSPSIVSAARPYLGKSVFCVDNVSTKVDEDNLTKFVKSLNVNVISCFKVQPRRSSWQKKAGIVPKDRNTFRLCIASEDVKKLLNDEAWPAHISISTWSFKKAQTVGARNVETDRRHLLSSTVMPLDRLSLSVAEVQTVVPADHENATASAAAAAAKMAVTSSPSDVDNVDNEIALSVGRWEDAEDMESTTIYDHDGDDK